jgi:hypothetical protein
MKNGIAMYMQNGQIKLQLTKKDLKKHTSKVETTKDSAFLIIHVNFG